MSSEEAINHQQLLHLACDATWLSAYSAKQETGNPMKYQVFKAVDALKSKLDALRPLPQEAIEQIRADMRIKFTYHSNAIEGNTLTLSETKAVLEDGITISGKPLKEHLEAVGHSHAIDYLEALVQEQAPLTDKTLRELHSLILRGTDPAHAEKYRNLNIIISGATHIPPKAEHVIEEMDAFFLWYKTNNADLHPLEFTAKSDTTTRGGGMI